VRWLDKMCDDWMWWLNVVCNDWMGVGWLLDKMCDDWMWCTMINWGVWWLNKMCKDDYMCDVWMRNAKIDVQW